MLDLILKNGTLIDGVKTPRYQADIGIQGDRIVQMGQLDAVAAHQCVTNVLALGVSKALWDLSPEAATPLVESILEDYRIVSATVLDAQNASFHAKDFPERRFGEVVSLV